MAAPLRRFIPTAFSTTSEAIVSLSAKTADARFVTLPLPKPPQEAREGPRPLKGAVTEGAVLHEGRNLKGIQFFTDNSRVYVAPSIYPETHPFYLPKGVAKKHGIEGAFRRESSLKGLIAPKGAPKHPTFGKKAHITLDGKKKEVEVIGFDYQERPIVSVVGDPKQTPRIITNRKEQKALIPSKEEYSLCAETLVEGKIYKPNSHFRHLMHHALTTPIVGNKSAMSYIDWLNHHGSECFVLGGAVRDICHSLVNVAHLTDEDAVRIVNDIDVSAVAAVPTARKMFHEIHGDNPDLHVDGAPQFGCLHAKLGDGAGFDFNAMMLGNSTYDPRTHHPDIPDEGPIVPAKFGGLPERCAEALDFCCNSLMYDPVNEVIIDPTGYGLEDAVNGFLRLTGGTKLLESPEETLVSKQSDMIQRFWKFRLRGMKSNAYTTLIFQESARERWSKVEKIIFYNDIKRMLPIGKLKGTETEKKEQLFQMLDQLKEKMSEDDRVTETPFELFEQFIAPDTSQIVDYILNYKKPM
jgi:hypothetical protein